MEILRRILYCLRRRRFEAELHEEMQFHQDLAGGRRFGNVMKLKEESRAAWGWVWLERWVQDGRYALRTMAASRTFAALAVLSLALGIGANTAIYSFMESILLRPLPVPDAESLVIMKWRADPNTPLPELIPGYTGFSLSTGGTHSDPETGTTWSVFPYSALDIFREETDALSGVFGYFRTDQLNLTIGDETTAVTAEYVTPDYFPGMGVRAAAGRLIGQGDDPTAAVAVLGHAFSRAHFGDPSRAVGQTVRVNDRVFTITGVVPPEFFGADPGSIPDLYVPIETIRLLEPQIGDTFLGESFYWVEIMGRLRFGITPEQAEAALDPRFRQLFRPVSETPPDVAQPELTLMAGASGLDSLRLEYSRSIYVLMAMVGVILLIACANIANLLLARSTARRREIAVRLSIGAGRLRVVRQLLTESVILSLVGGAIGLLVAAWGMRVLTLLMANGRENFTLHAELNGHVLLMTAFLSILTGLLFGLVPAIQSTRVDLTSALKGTSPASLGWGFSSGRGFAAGPVLVIAQIGLALVLLTGAGLFGRTLVNLYAIDVGFDRTDVLLFRLNTRSAGYEGPALRQVFEQVRQRLAEIPGVVGASLSTRALPSGGTMAPIDAISGAAIPEATDGEPAIMAGLLNVGPAFFSTMRIPVLGGREFDDGDQTGTPPVVIVNERLARAFGLENPVGRTLETRMGDEETYEIVGVVGDALWAGLKQDLRPVVYFPYTQRRPPIQMAYEVRTSGEPLAYARSVLEAVRQFDSRLAVSDVTTQSAHLDRAISQEIVLARLASGFAMLALLIACIGLYSTVAYQTVRRTNEIGVRVALGATRSGVIWLLVRSVLVVQAVGLCLGIPAALAAAGLTRSFLFGIEPRDLPTILLAVVALTIASFIAAYIPARRASMIDPMAALRHE